MTWFAYVNITWHFKISKADTWDSSHCLLCLMVLLVGLLLSACMFVCDVSALAWLRVWSCTMSYTLHFFIWCSLSYSITRCKFSSTCFWITRRDGRKIWGVRGDESVKRRKKEGKKRGKVQKKMVKMTGRYKDKDRRKRQSKLRSVSWPRCSSFNGRFMFAGSLITYGRRRGGKDPEQQVCLGNEEVWRSERKEEEG